MRWEFDTDALLTAGEIEEDAGHKWGRELRVVNENEYCGKFLEMQPYVKSSYHKHPKKETFLILAGRLVLMFNKGWGRSLVVLSPGMTWTLERDVPHQFWCEEPTIFIEFSEHHNDEDVVRLEKGGAMQQS